MMKMDLGTGSGSKIFQLNDEDIELIVRLLHVECDHHVYHIELDVDQGYFKDRYDHMQDLIMELTK
jgi:hypothetical protein